MRPHVELIHEDDYIWHVAELPGGEGRASERRLSVDEEDGSSSLRVDFHTAWGRGPGIHHANSEFYVLDGELTYGDRTIGKGGYAYLPRGVPVDAVRFAEGTSVLHYREYGDAGFDPVDAVGWSDAPRWDDAREEAIVLDTEAMTFDTVTNAGPMPGLSIKYLHVDPTSGFYTRLVFAQEGWADHRLAHHPCYEEAYTVQGHMEYNFGTLDLGTYFFRPARVKHGHFTTMEGGATWLLRSDGELMNWYSQNEYVRWGAEAVNYSPTGGRMSWSQSTTDLAGGRTWRTDRDLADLQTSVQFQLDGGAQDAPYVQHGLGSDRSLIEIAKALDAARLQGGHTEDHVHDDGTIHAHGAGESHEHSPALTTAALGWPDPASLEHADERTDSQAHNWGAGRPWKVGDPNLAPIISSLPVRSRSRGRWDADGM